MLCYYAIDSQTNNITTIADLFDILNLFTLPNYWWSDEYFLASIANHYN